MEKHRKLLLAILMIFITIIITSCSPTSSYQKSIFDDNNKIVRQADSYTYLSKTGSREEKEAEIKFNSFSGMDTIYNIESDGDNEFTIDFNVVVEDGDFKVVLITPEDEVINIVDDTKDGTEVILVGQGVSRIKLVGKKAKGEIKLSFESEIGIEIRPVK